MVLAVIAIISTVLVILFIILWRKCIARLIAILKEVTKVFRSMIFIVFWPCWDLMGQVGHNPQREPRCALCSLPLLLDEESLVPHPDAQALVVTYGFFTLYFCANAPESLFPHVGWKILALIGQVFVVFWTSQFVCTRVRASVWPNHHLHAHARADYAPRLQIRATIWTSMSAAISRWYVTDNAVFAEKKCCGFGTGLGALMGGTCIIVTKHLGSMAFGALIIAVMQTIRAIVLAIDKNTQELQKGNCLLRLTFQCVQCCLACIQRTVEMITYYVCKLALDPLPMPHLVVHDLLPMPDRRRGPMICTAGLRIRGDARRSVLQGVRRNHGLHRQVHGPNRSQPDRRTLAQYPHRLVDTHALGRTRFLVSRVSALPPRLACHARPRSRICRRRYGAGDYPEQYNTLWTSAITFLTSFIVTSGVTMVYDCAIDTIYLCAFKDLDDPGGPKFMSNDLREGFGLDKAAEEVGEKAANYKSQTQRRREKKENAYAATPADGAQSGMDIRQDSSVATVDQV